jgi:hypothetical protein
LRRHGSGLLLLQQHIGKQQHEQQMLAPQGAMPHSGRESAIVDRPAIENSEA